MRRLLVWSYGLALFCAANLPGLAQPATSPSLLGRTALRPHLADYDSELRRPDGRVDADLLVARLKDLGVTTYYWLI